MSATYRVTLDGRPCGLAAVSAAGVTVRLFFAAPDQIAWAEGWLTHLLGCGAEFDALTRTARGGRWEVARVPARNWNRPRPEGGGHCPPPAARHNPDLDAAFAEPLSAPARPAADLRHNPDLDAVFGV